MKNKKNVLFLRNWIRSGVNKIGDLGFIDGVLDEKFIFNKIKIKTNIYAEISIVKKALRPYKAYLNNMVNMVNAFQEDDKMSLTKSKQAYQMLLKNKLELISCMSLYLSDYCTKVNISLEEAFQEKLCNEKEIKVKEFNFKIMHNILPCNYKLYKWKKIDNYNCDVCGIKQDMGIVRKCI